MDSPAEPLLQIGECGMRVPECRARILPLLHDISLAITGKTEIREVMDKVASTIAGHMDRAERIHLTVFNRKTGSIFIDAAYGLNEEEKARGVYGPGEGITGKVVSTGLPIIVPNIAKEPGFLNRTGSRAHQDTKTIAFLCVPVKEGREVMGTLGVDVQSGPEENLGQDLELLMIIAAMIAQRVSIHRARQEELHELRESNLRLQEELAARYHPSNIIGTSKPMQAVFRLMEKVFAVKTPVLILGETGVGKELVAQALHFKSPHAEGPFVKFNCAAVPENLAESELFGHEKGAFTGALAQRIGKFEEADGGTLFLDEIGELSPAVQAKLLRVLQQNEFERVGSNRTLKVDIRIIAATNRDLPLMIQQGQFREDLYYRLNVFPITLPPLRERGSDIVLLADFFVGKYSERYGGKVKRISPPAVEMLLSHHWPGNVRELENIIERAVILAEDEGVIREYHLPPSLQTAESTSTPSEGALDQRMKRVEREFILETLRTTRGNMAAAARVLGITERLMALRVKEHRIEPKRFKKNEKEKIEP
jgi:Nif-specific regulatory protein